jgi:molybdopterin synthase sulfur carrier subunit
MHIRLYATLRQIVGGKRVDLPVKDGTPLEEVLRDLVREYPDLDEAIWGPEGGLAGHVAVLLNGRNVRHLEGLETKLSEGDVLDLFPPVGGGRRRAPERHITLKFTSHFRGRLGIKETPFAFQGDRVRDLVQAVVARYDVKDLLLESSGLRDYVRIAVNGRFARYIGGWEAEIPEGATVVFIHSYVVAF